MFKSITNVIFAFVAVICLLIGLFWLWFLYEFSLKWAKYDGNIPPDAGATAVFGSDGAWWIGLVAGGWLILAVVFWIIHRRTNRTTSA